MRRAGAGVGEAADRRVGQVHAVREPDVRAEPAELVGVLGRGAAERVAAVLLLVERLGQVGVQPDAVARGPARRDCASARALTENGEHGASRDPQHRVGRRVVVAGDRRLGGGQDRRRGAPPPRPAAARRRTAPRSIEPRRGVETQPDLPGRLDLGAEQVAAVAREDVVVVGGGGAAGLAPARPGRRAPRRRGCPRSAGPRSGTARPASRTAPSSWASPRVIHW